MVKMDLRYPIGPFDDHAPITADMRQLAITTIAELPSQLKDAVAGLPDVHLDTPYRPNGWTVRQVVHHLADSHMNAYVRTKLCLTEHEPTIKPRTTRIQYPWRTAGSRSTRRCRSWRASTPAGRSCGDPLRHLNSRECSTIRKSRW